MPQIIFLKPLFGALPKIGDWIEKYYHGFQFSKMVLKSVLA